MRNDHKRGKNCIRSKWHCQSHGCEQTTLVVNCNIISMKHIFIVTLVLMLGCCPAFISAQTISREELIFLTSAWKGERFGDGRPKVADDLIRRAKSIAIEDAWTILQNEGYTCQY